MTWSYLQEHVIIGGQQHSVLIKLFHNLLRRHIIQDRVAVVKLGGDKSMDENLGSLGRKEFSYEGIVTQMVEG